jgi:hypothetical protein
MSIERARHEARLLMRREALVWPVYTYRISPDGSMAFGACTIGATLENRVGELFRAGERLLALELDGLGNERLFCLAKRALSTIGRDAKRRGQRAGDERYPGDDGMTLEEQVQALEFACADTIGIAVTSGGMLSPVKSMSFLVPLGAELKKTRGGPCRRCPSRARCTSVRR